MSQRTHVMAKRAMSETLIASNKINNDTYSGTLWKEGKNKLKAYHCIINNGNFYCYKDPKSKKAKFCILMCQTQISLEDDVKFIIDTSKKNKGYKFITANQQDREIWSQHMLAAGSNIFSKAPITPNEYVSNPNKKNQENPYYEVNHYEKIEASKTQETNLYELDVESTCYIEMSSNETQEKTDMQIYQNLPSYVNKCDINADQSKRGLKVSKNEDVSIYNQAHQSKIISELNICNNPLRSSESIYQNVNDLVNFHYKDIDRLRCESLLSKKQVGCFLIRNAKKDNNEVLSVLTDTNGLVKHYKIYELEGKHYLDPKGVKFTAVLQLICYYKVHCLPNCNAYLTQPCLQ